MATFRLWLFAILIIIEEIAMGWFGNKDNSSTSPTTGTVPTPAVTPAVDPGATPDPSTTVASATPVPDPVTPVTVPLPTTKVVDPVPAATPAGEVRAPQTPSEWWAVSKDSARQARKRLSWQEILSYILQLTILWAAGFLEGPTLTLTSAQMGVVIVTTVICTVALWSLFWKFWVPDERAAQHFGTDRGLDAFLQLAVALVAIYQLIRILM